jgi:fluoride exporter
VSGVSVNGSAAGRLRLLVGRLPIDPDLLDAYETSLAGVRRPRVAGVVAIGGVVGALGRAGIARLWSHSPTGWPWATFVTNVSGCVLIAVLLVVQAERLPHRPYLRPLLGTGVLGGYTTFSTYALDTRDLLAAGRPALAAAYLFGTVLVGLLAVVAAVRVTERVLR